MLRRLFEEQYADSCPFAQSKELLDLNSAILYAVRDYVTGEPLTAEELARLLDDCQRLEAESKRLQGDANIYAQRTLELGRMVMSGQPIGSCLEPLRAC